MLNKTLGNVLMLTVEDIAGCVAAPGWVDVAPCPQVRGGGHAGLTVPVREGAHRAVLERVAPSRLTAACAGEPPVTTAQREKNKHDSFI